MTMHDLPEDNWHKSSYSSDTGGNCIETQLTPEGLVAVRDSKTPALGAHTFTRAEWQHFVNAVRNGTFDV
jgi:hypothetical protein